MSRTVSEDHAREFVVEWRQRLLKLHLDTLRPGRRRDLFEDVLGWRGKPQPHGMVARISSGLDTLLAALRSDRAGTHGDSPALDAWIVGFLLTRGPSLLTSEAARLAHLARIRDGNRRHDYAERGHRAATIVMPSAAWDALERIRNDRGLPSLGRTLAALIRETAAANTPASRAKARGRGKEATNPDLLDQLGLSPNERRA
jgi:hypothetical protein